MRCIALAIALCACSARPESSAPVHQAPPETPRDASPPPDAPAATTVPPNAMKLDALLNTPPTSVSALLSLRDFTEDEIRAVLGPRVENVAYEKLRPVDRYGEKAGTHAYFFFRGKTLVMVYGGDDDYLAGLSLASVQKELGRAEKIVRSRQGKTATQHLYPSKGFACSEDGGALGFIEVFPPMTLAAYLAQVYEDPGEFIK